jgi:hypothetical protein
MMAAIMIGRDIRRDDETKERVKGVRGDVDGTRTEITSHLDVIVRAHAHAIAPRRVDVVAMMSMMAPAIMIVETIDQDELEARSLDEGEEMVADDLLIHRIEVGRQREPKNNHLGTMSHQNLTEVDRLRRVRVVLFAKGHQDHRKMCLPDGKSQYLHHATMNPIH